MIWPYDTSEPRITPEGLVEHYCEREGVSREQILLPPTLVATFQNASYARLAEQTDAKVPPEFERRSSGGTALGAQFRIGRTPRAERPIAVTRLPVGAPATALALESAIARGARDILVCGSAGSLQPP
jgi:nucleoside phosphorylase